MNFLPRKKKPIQKRIYLDYASATPIDKKVQEVMTKISAASFGNPSSLYKEGVSAKEILAKSREDISLALGARREEIFFNSGGTEGNNLAIRGSIGSKKNSHIVTTNIEHSSVLEVCRALEKEGVSVTYVPVESNGVVDPKKIRAALRPDTILVSVMYANNEIGTIQPIREIAKEVRHFRKQSLGQKKYPLFHTDACQAVNYLPLNVVQLGIDLMTINSSKIYGPKGVGALYKNANVSLSPMLFGGMQEQGFRPGTEPIALIAGFAEAVKITRAITESESSRLIKLRDFLMEGLIESFPACWINGDRTLRVPNNINVSFPNLESELLVLELDAKGFAVSSKSACKTSSPDNSYVLAAIGRSNEGRGTLRITLGRNTQKEDLNHFIRTLAGILQKYASV